MIFNPSKCEYLRITNKIYPLVSHYDMEGQPVKEVSSAKYLDIMINQTLSWSKHVKNFIKANCTKAFLQ